MKSPFTGGEVRLQVNDEMLNLKGVEVEIRYHNYQCQDTGQEFTTAEIDQFNIDQVKHKVIPILAEKGFMIEIGTDGWANWTFDSDGNPKPETATPPADGPAYLGYVWRGCYKYFDTDNNLVLDDVGTGSYEECLDRCLDVYKREKDNIREGAFGGI